MIVKVEIEAEDYLLECLFSYQCKLQHCVRNLSNFVRFPREQASL